MSLINQPTNGELTLIALSATVSHPDECHPGRYAVLPVGLFDHAGAVMMLDQLAKPLACVAFPLGGALAVCAWHVQKHVAATGADAAATDASRNTLQERLISVNGSSDLLVVGLWKSARVSLKHFWQWQDEYDLLYSSRVIVTEHPAIAPNDVGGVVLYRPVANDCLVSHRLLSKAGSANVGGISKAIDPD